jgi:hypothetical protein
MLWQGPSCTQCTVQCLGSLVHSVHSRLGEMHGLYVQGVYRGWGRHEFCLLAAQFRETVLFWILPNFGETFAKFALISH